MSPRSVEARSLRTQRASARALRWIALTLIAAAAFAYVFQSRGRSGASDVGRLAVSVRALEDEFGIPIGGETLDEFERRVGRTTVAGIRVTSADAQRADEAIGPLRTALSKYPPGLLRFLLSGIYLAESITLEDRFPVGGTYGGGAIYLLVGRSSSDAAAREVELAFHHEFSSLLYLYAGNDASPGASWDAQNPGNFSYATTPEAEMEAAAAPVRSSEAESWYADGFVHPYGRSSKENDVNTYAELLMGHPERLVKLATRWPRIDAKARILARFYAEIDPALEDTLRRGPAEVLLPFGR